MKLILFHKRISHDPRSNTTWNWSPLVEKPSDAACCSQACRRPTGSGFVLPRVGPMVQSSLQAPSLPLLLLIKANVPTTLPQPHLKEIFRDFQNKDVAKKTNAVCVELECHREILACKFSLMKTEGRRGPAAGVLVSSLPTQSCSLASSKARVSLARGGEMAGQRIKGFFTLSCVIVVTVCLLTGSQPAGRLKLRSHLVRSEANPVSVVYSSVLHVLAETDHQNASECQRWCWVRNLPNDSWPVSHREARAAVLAPLGALLWSMIMHLAPSQLR